MFMNPHLFFLAHPSHVIAWNYKDHLQFELTPEFYLRLFEILRDPARFDIAREMDGQLLQSGLLTEKLCDTESWGWDVLSKIYHFGTKDVPYASPPKNLNEWAQQYTKHCDEAIARVQPRERQLDTEKFVALPPPISKIEHLSLVKVLLTRKTSRQFKKHPITLRAVSTILHYALGYPKERIENDNLVFEECRKRRCSPSGGGLNCIEGYIYCSRATPLSPGLYYYDAERHRLIFQSEINEVPLGDLLSGQHFINELPFGVFLTGRLDKLWWKYEHSRAYRMALIEAGHVSQCIQLIATALGLNTWLTGAINESSVEALMTGRRDHEEVLFFTGAGYSNGEAIPDVLKLRLTENKNDKQLRRNRVEKLG